MTTPTKPKIAKADFMLLFIRINSVYDELNARTDEMERVFKFEHIQNRFQPSDHSWSQDKNAVSHCYRDIQQDHYYFIFAHRVPELKEVKANGRIFNRWVWRVAVELSDKQIRLAYKFFLKNPDAPKEVSKYVDSLLNPTATELISEFSYEGDKNATIS